VTIIKKKNFYLTNININTKKIYNIITYQIPRSIFTILDVNFFNKLVKDKIVEIFIIKKEKKIASVISVITNNNYKLLRKKIFLYFLFNPHKLFLNIFFIFSNFDRSTNNIKLDKDKDYLQLLHLVIFKNYFKNISLKKKDEIINFFLTKIIKKYDAKFFYLCYEKDNLRAYNYYRRNKFKTYIKSKKTIFVKKRIR
tara:strand:- start:1492 stop:2082 length:591 start_codon:yes stop_codon:yes gene_type:complete